MPRTRSKWSTALISPTVAKLDQVIQRLTAPGKAARDVFGHRKLTADQLRAQPSPLEIVGIKRGIAVAAK